MPRIGLPPWTSGLSPFCGLRRRDLAVLHRQPGPAGAELGDARLDEVFLGLVDRAEPILQRLLEFARNFPAALRFHPLPEVGVVIMLPCVVEHRGILAERPLDDFLQRLAFPLGSLERVVAVVDIGQVVLVVMKFERLARHDRSQRVVRIRQFGQREGHGTAPWEVRGEIGTLSDVIGSFGRQSSRPPGARQLRRAAGRRRPSSSRRWPGARAADRRRPMARRNALT